MWCFVPLLGLGVGGLVGLLTRDARRSLLAGVIGALLAGLFVALLLYATG